MTSPASHSIPSTVLIGVGWGGWPVNHPFWKTEQRQSEISRLQSICQINSRTQYNCDHIRANCISHHMENHKISLMDFYTEQQERRILGREFKTKKKKAQNEQGEIKSCFWNIAVQIGIWKAQCSGPVSMSTAGGREKDER